MYSSRPTHDTTGAAVVVVVVVDTVLPIDTTQAPDMHSPPMPVLVQAVPSGVGVDV